MTRFLLSSTRIALVLAAMTLSSAAFAQATRTWVSGVGDDVNPCSRTAPCKTFAGAISKTAAGGEISVLDPGGYGAVTITKPITISGDGTLASILSSATNGINVNIDTTTYPNAFVVIRNISINGAGGVLGLNGIRFLSGTSLTLDGVTLQNFSSRGIEFAPSGSAELNIRNTRIENALGGALVVQPGGTANVMIEDCNFFNSFYGVLIHARTYLAMDRCVLSGNTNFGVWVYAPATAAQATVSNTTISGNGVSALSGGIRSEGANARVYFGSNTITNNTTGLISVAGGSITSFGNNQLAANGSDGNPTATGTTR